MKRILMVLAATAAISITGAALGQREPSDEEKERARIRIGITKEQQIQIEGIFADARRQESEIHAKTRELYGQLFSLYEVYDYDRDLAKKLRRDIGKQNYRRMLINAETQDKLRKVLTRDQFDRMTQYGREMRDKWRRENPRRMPPGGFRP